MGIVCYISFRTLFGWHYVISNELKTDTMKQSNNYLMSIFLQFFELKIFILTETFPSRSHPMKTAM